MKNCSFIVLVFWTIWLQQFLAKLQNIVLNRIYIKYSAKSDIYEQMKYENCSFNICQTIHENEFIMMNLMLIAE